MTVEVALNTPLADALNAAIQPKLVEAGWGNGDGNEASLAELIILMLANGNQEEQIAAELAGDLLGLSPEDSSARDFARWLFEQIDTINGQLNGTSQADKDHADASYSGDMDTDMGSNDASGLNAYVPLLTARPGIMSHTNRTPVPQDRDLCEMGTPEAEETGARWGTTPDLTTERQTQASTVFADKPATSASTHTLAAARRQVRETGKAGSPETTIGQQQSSAAWITGATRNSI
jgi:hypothetical protein